MRESMTYNMDTYQFREDVLLKILKMIQCRDESTLGKTLFFGDSLVEQIPDCYDILNHGIGGTCSHVWESLLDELVIKFEPKNVVLHIGTNDLGETVMASPRQIALNVERIFRILRRNLPHTKFYLISVLPCVEHLQSYHATSRTIRSNDMIDIVNRELKEHVCFGDVAFLDLNQHLYHADGGVKESYYSDGLHLNEDGYAYLYSKIKV